MDADIAQCEHCRALFMPEQEHQKYCSVQHREAAKKKRQRSKSRIREIAEKLHLTGDTGDISDEDGIAYGDDDTETESERRAREADERWYRQQFDAQAFNVPQDTLNEWARWERSKGGGTVHPDRQRYLIERGREVRARDWSQGTARFQQENPYSNIAEARRASQKLNAHHRKTDQRPVGPILTPSPGSAVALPESIDGAFLRGERGVRRGGRAHDGSFSMTDGFQY